MTRLEIKAYAQSKKVYMWELAEKLGYTASWLTVLLRHPPKGFDDKCIKAIDEIAKDKSG